jgi:DNA-binding CsgD family transcriptional regulator
MSVLTSAVINQSALSFPQQYYQRQPSAASKLDFFQAVLEGLADGVLIVSTEGELVHTNHRGRYFCQQFQENSSRRQIPESIWQVCQSLIESRDLFPEEQLVLESEIVSDRDITLRLRVRWFDLVDGDRPYLLITLEDYGQSLQDQAASDIKKYGFTSREAEVWALRHAKYSYKEIATKLYISLNTVKKHIKNINAKRQAVMWAEADA